MTQKPPAFAPDPFSLFSVIAVLIGLAFAGTRLVSIGSQQDAMLKALQDIKLALQQRPGAGAAGQNPQVLNQNAPRPPAPPENVSLTVADSAVEGPADAKLTLVEFSDFECPFCGRYIRDTYDQIQRDYVKAGKVRYVFRHYPLEQLHPHALKAGIAAECARRQGKFWDMHDRLFANQKALAEADLTKTAGASGLNLSTYQSCMSGDGEKRVRQDMEEGAKAGVGGTPYFFVGVTEAGGKVKVLRRLSGAQPYAAFKSALDELLKDPKAAS